MNYAQIMAFVMKYGRLLGPRALKAWNGIAFLADKNPQLAKLSDEIGNRLAARRPGSKLQTQIQLALELATNALTTESLPEHQDLARTWVKKANGLDMRLRAAEVGPAKLKKVRRADVGQQVDLLLMEIVETVAKWAES